MYHPLENERIGTNVLFNSVNLTCENTYVALGVGSQKNQPLIKYLTKAGQSGGKSNYTLRTIQLETQCKADNNERSTKQHLTKDSLSGELSCTVMCTD